MSLRTCVSGRSSPPAVSRWGTGRERRGLGKTRIDQTRAFSRVGEAWNKVRQPGGRTVGSPLDQKICVVFATTQGLKETRLVARRTRMKWALIVQEMWRRDGSTYGGYQNGDRGSDIGKQRLVHCERNGNLGTPVASLYSCATGRTEK